FHFGCGFFAILSHVDGLSVLPEVPILPAHALLDLVGPRATGVGARRQLAPCGGGAAWLALKVGKPAEEQSRRSTATAAPAQIHVGEVARRSARIFVLVPFPISPCRWPKQQWHHLLPPDHRSHVPPPSLLHLRQLHRILHGVDDHHQRGGIASTPTPSCLCRVPGALALGDARARRRTPPVRRIAVPR
ncbi:hypothetical protein E2562_031403, partial [Oryza meyeriana var. granulata]